MILRSDVRIRQCQRTHKCGIDAPDDVDADVEEGHEEPEALMREQFSYMFQGLQVGS